VIVRAPRAGHRLRAPGEPSDHLENKRKKHLREVLRGRGPHRRGSHLGRRLLRRSGISFSGRPRDQNFTFWRSPCGNSGSITAPTPTSRTFPVLHRRLRLHLLLRESLRELLPIQTREDSRHPIVGRDHILDLSSEPFRRFELSTGIIKDHRFGGPVPRSTVEPKLHRDSRGDQLRGLHSTPESALPQWDGASDRAAFVQETTRFAISDRSPGARFTRASYSPGEFPLPPHSQPRRRKYIQLTSGACWRCDSAASSATERIDIFLVRRKRGTCAASSTVVRGQQGLLRQRRAALPIIDAAITPSAFSAPLRGCSSSTWEERSTTGDLQTVHQRPRFSSSAPSAVLESRPASPDGFGLDEQPSPHSASG
jgi:hypothetical protein